jgi:hypothetical protein
MSNDTPPILNPDEQLQRLIPPLENDLASAGISPEEIAATVDIAGKFCAIASEQLNQQPGFQATENDPFIPFEPQHGELCLELFMAGTQHAALRCWELGIRGELTSLFLQNLAQDVFLQSKQIVATTVGEHLTPELKFPHEQMVGWITQAAESALIYYVNEYEKANGPLFQEPIDTNYPDYTTPSSATSYSDTKQPSADSLSTNELPDMGYTTHPPGTYPPPEQPTGYGERPTPAVTASANPTAPSGQPDYDKWAALALFITTLNDSLQAQWIALFGPQEQAVLRHYMEAQHVLAERNVPVVTQHLSHLKQFLQQGTVQPDYRDKRAMQAALEVLATKPVEEVLWLSKFERPLAQRYIQVLAEAQRRNNPAWLAKAPKLSPDLKACIADFLAACL